VLSPQCPSIAPDRRQGGFETCRRPLLPSQLPLSLPCPSLTITPRVNGPSIRQNVPKISCRGWQGRQTKGPQFAKVRAPRMRFLRFPVAFQSSSCSRSNSNVVNHSTDLCGTRPNVARSRSMLSVNLQICRSICSSSSSRSFFASFTTGWVGFTQK